MKKRINLFDQKKDKATGDDLYKKILKTSIVILLLVIIIGLGLYLYSNSLDDKTKSLKLSETIANHKLQASSKNSQKLNTLMKNKGVLELHLKDDAQFLPYYRLLTNVLLAAEGDPVLTSITIDKLRVTNFKLKFENYTNLRKFLVTAESDNFVKHFDHIGLAPFNVSDGVEDYTLDLHGTFSTILTLNE